MATSGLPCLNCGKAVTEEDGKLFASCFVCPDCYFIAARFMENGRKELSQLLVLLQEIVRQQIVKGTLQLSPRLSESPSKRDVLEAIVRMLPEEIRDRAKNG